MCMMFVCMQEHAKSGKYKKDLVDVCVKTVGEFGFIENFVKLLTIWI